MASSSGPALNEELQCSICLEVFTDPVTTPCGHNFCRTCLSKCWTNTQTCFCPLCKERFSRKPDLKINTTLREVVQHFKKLNQEFEVFCDICDERKQKAVKTCLTCQSSYCDDHLEPHLRVPRLKKHTLINAVENLEDYICQKHKRPLEMFCRDDQTCVCLSCIEGEHRNHNTVPIEEESQEKNQMVQTQTDVHQMIQDRMKKIQEIQYSVELRKRNTEKEKSSSVEIFTHLIRSTERCQSELLKMMEEQQKEAEKQAEDLIKELNQEITGLKRRNTEVEQLSHTDNHLHVIQMYSSLYSRPHTKNWSEIRIDSDVNVNRALYRALTQLKNTLNKKLYQTGLKSVQKYAVDVTLDPDTANPYFILSDDGKQVSDGDIKQDVPENPKRFDVSCVLAKEGFSSGRFYYEVQVKGKTDWRLGVIRESIKRKGSRLRLSPDNGVWTVILMNEDQYKACEDSTVLLSLKVKPEKVGVFVDYEEGLVSFYDVDSRSHIYSFTGQTFTDKLYPYFNPCNNDEGKNSRPLIITPVS